VTPRQIAALAAFNALAALVVLGFVSLAAWQIERRAWKLDLIARSDARVHAAPVPAPHKDRWQAVSAANDEYRRVTLSGRWRDTPPALVRAVTELGGGYWVMAALARDDGTIVMVNRGFIPEGSAKTGSGPTPGGEQTIVGKLRVSEPAGAFLRSNDAKADRWFSRDVTAIARSRGLADVAPYFVDAEGEAARGTLPVPGLTVMAFSNNHLIYAITWAVLALMSAAATVYVNYDSFGMRRRQAARFQARRRIFQHPPRH
jgi:surfeit locus 1 family protein